MHIAIIDDQAATRQATTDQPADQQKERPLQLDKPSLVKAAWACSIKC